jgi:hypothetical protein
MGEPKENRSFFRKVVQFVSNPTMEWGELTSRPDDGKSTERSELRAMVERKRRNDFVRKREFDTLRRVRREGLTPEQLMALGPSSRLDDGESRFPSEAAVARTQGVVKAKIDHIEREMVGDGPGFRGSKTAAFFDAPTEPGVLARRGPGSLMAPLSGVPRVSDVLEEGVGVGAAPSNPDLLDLPDLPDLHLSELPLLDDPTSRAPSQPASASEPSAQHGLTNGATPAFPVSAPDQPDAALATEVQHDPELDEAVISFANADFNQCERSLQQLIRAGGLRAQHAETWLVMFDLYRATGQQHSFESLANDYAHQFGWSAPQWYSIPQHVAEVKAERQALSGPMPLVDGEVGWIAPAVLDTESVSRLRSQCLQLPMPWVLDWSHLQQMEVEAATQLSTLFRLWAGQQVAMRWVGAERLFAALAEAAPTGVRDADPAFWLVRLDALRLINRADQFDETAIDYCVTYEVSPPSWERARCTVRTAEAGQRSTMTPQLSITSEVSTSFQDSGIAAPSGMIQVANVDMSGQLVGDLADTLNRINVNMGSAPIVEIHCANLIRVDFIAAGDLLNWVLSRRQEDRQIHFVDTHRLIALFFSAMGINEHAQVQIRRH